MHLSFACVGPQRTATSWLDRVLRQHPEVMLPDGVKETFFLDERFDRGWDWYENKFFPAAGSGFVAGEIAPTCFDNPAVIGRLTAHSPRCRIIVCVRDPVARSISLYNHLYAKSRTNLRFDAACAEHPSIIGASRYRTYIGDWVSAFGAESVLLLPNTSVERAPEESIRRLALFLGVSGEVEMPASLRERYGEKGAPRNRHLVRVMDRAAWWLRYAGFNRVVNFGKKLGLKKMVYSGGRDVAPELTADERRRLEQELASERVFSRELEQFGVTTAAEFGVDRLS